MSDDYEYQSEFFLKNKKEVFGQATDFGVWIEFTATKEVDISNMGF